MSQPQQPRRSRGRPRGILVYGSQIETDRRLRYARARAQAHFRDEVWRLTYEQWVEAWGPYIDRHGRDSDEYSLLRADTHLGWIPGNVFAETRMFQNRYRYLRQQNPDLPLARIREMTTKSIQDDPRSIQQRRQDKLRNSDG